MNKLQELKAQRDHALKIGDMQQLSEINKQIFAIREQIRKAKEKARQQAQDEKTAQKIDTGLSFRKARILGHR